MGLWPPSGHGQGPYAPSPRIGTGLAAKSRQRVGWGPPFTHWVEQACLAS